MREKELAHGAKMPPVDQLAQVRPAQVQGALDLVGGAGVGPARAGIPQVVRQLSFPHVRLLSGAVFSEKGCKKSRSPLGKRPSYH
jgi:hypothetical protein